MSRGPRSQAGECWDKIFAARAEERAAAGDAAPGARPCRVFLRRERRSDADAAALALPGAAPVAPRAAEVPGRLAVNPVASRSLRDLPTEVSCRVSLAPAPLRPCVSASTPPR